MTSGTSTGLPLLTTRATAEPARTVVPDPGLVEITKPLATSSLNARVTMPGSSPSSSSSVRALSSL